MEHPEKALSAAAIKYLLTIAELCGKRPGARCVDIAGRMGVSKPGAHSMIRNLCEAGLAEKERYGTVFLTDAGREAAELYASGDLTRQEAERLLTFCNNSNPVRCAAGCRKRWGWRKRPAGTWPAPSLRRSRNGSQSLPCA